MLVGKIVIPNCLPVCNLCVSTLIQKSCQNNFLIEVGNGFSTYLIFLAPPNFWCPVPGQPLRYGHHWNTYGNMKKTDDTIKKQPGF